MPPCKPLLLILSLMLVPAALVEARNTDGTLGLIRTPNNGMPVITTPGQSFDATLLEQADLRLRGDAAEIPLTVSWREERGGRVLGRCTLPQDISPGVYALYAQAASRTDENLRSVHILDAIPDTYGIVHITDTHAGTSRHQRPDRDILLDIFQAANASDAAFALITGDLTDDGTPEQFQRFLEILDTSRLPTFVTPGNHDRKENRYADFFETLAYAFQFGRDGYLSFDTKDYLIADEMDVQNTRLYAYRRKLRPCRWGVGFTHRYDLAMGMRAQLTLFVDDPLDYLAVGHTHSEAAPEDGIPWARTALIMTPAAINGSLRFLTVDEQGVHAAATVTPVSIVPGESPAPLQ